MAESISGEPQSTKLGLGSLGPTLRRPGEGPVIGVVGDVYRFLATGAETAGHYAVWEAIVPPGGGPPPHIHSREVEWFYVLAGEMVFHADGERIVATAGTSVHIPIGCLHAFRNESDATARMLIAVAPAGLENMFFEVGHPLASDADTAPPPAREEIDRLLAAAPRYSVEIKIPH